MVQIRMKIGQDYKRIWCPDSFAPEIQNCKRISHAAPLLLRLANNAATVELKHIITSARDAVAIAKGMVELRSIVFYSGEERGRWRQGPRCLRCSKIRRIGGLRGLRMTPQRSSGYGARIPVLTTRRHRVLV